MAKFMIAFALLAMVALAQAKPYLGGVPVIGGLADTAGQGLLQGAGGIGGGLDFGVGLKLNAEAAAAAKAQAQAQAEIAAAAAAQGIAQGGAQGLGQGVGQLPEGVQGLPVGY